MLPFLFLAGLAIGLAIWFFAIYALPCAIGLSAALWAYESGAGVLGAGVVGLAGASLSFTALSVAYRKVAYPPFRFLLAAVVCAPSIAVGYHVAEDLAVLGGASEAWQPILSIGGAGFIGVIAFARLAGLDAEDDPPSD